MQESRERGQPAAVATAQDSAQPPPGDAGQAPSAQQPGQPPEAQPGDQPEAQPGEQPTTQPGQPPAPTAQEPAAPAPAAPAVEEPTQPISLQDAIAIAQRNHGSVGSAVAALQAAQQRIPQARAGSLPIVTGGISYGITGTSFRGGAGGVGRDSVVSDPGPQPRVGLSYNVFNGGLTRASVRQAQAGVQTSEASLVATRNNLAFGVAQAYLAQLQADRLLALRRTQEQLAEDQLRRVEARIEAEAAPQVDRALPLSELRNRQVDRIQAENQLRVAANALRNAMGLPVGPALELVEPEETVEALPTIETLRETARRQRPEVLQAEARVRSAQAGVDVARIERSPRVDVAATASLTPKAPSTRSLWDVEAAITMPLWDAGRSRARVRESEAELRNAQESLDQIRKDVAAEVEEAYLNLRNAQERLAASQLAVEAARANLEATTSRYELGVQGLSVVDLVTAQVQFDTANTNAIQARYDVRLALAQLNRAIGQTP